MNRNVAKSWLRPYMWPHSGGRRRQRYVLLGGRCGLRRVRRVGGRARRRHRWRHLFAVLQGVPAAALLGGVKRLGGGGGGGGGAGRRLGRDGDVRLSCRRHRWPLDELVGIGEPPLRLLLVAVLRRHTKKQCNINNLADATGPALLEALRFDNFFQCYIS